jgi:hypothetical protein
MYLAKQLVPGACNHLSELSSKRFRSCALTPYFVFSEPYIVKANAKEAKADKPFILQPLSKTLLGDLVKVRTVLFLFWCFAH